MSTNTTEGRLVTLLKDWWSLVAAVLAAIAFVAIRVFRLDIEHDVLVALLALLFFSLWLAWRLLPAGPVVKIVVSLVILALFVGLGWMIVRSSQPAFEIRALGTLEGDTNAYEVTDQLILDQGNLSDHGVAITFTLEIVPHYSGGRKYGSVVALISGDGDAVYEKEVWPRFDNGAEAQRIHLTLPQLLDASGLEYDNPLTRVLRPDGLPFRQARLVVRVAQQSNKTHPWASEEITIRNAPWNVRADPVQRQGTREVDVYVENEGATGEFTVIYDLVRMDQDISSSENPGASGATLIKYWNAPAELEPLGSGEHFTDTVELPDQLAPGRYLLDVYAIKKQEYVRFWEQAAAWKDVNSAPAFWLFAGPFERFVFLVTEPEFPIDLAVQAEWERVRDEEGVDLGIPLKPSEIATLDSGDTVVHQAYQEGEIVLHSGEAFALHGPVFDHYRGLGGADCSGLEYPLAPIQTVESSSGWTGEMMEFKGLDNSPPSVIYASGKGTALVEGWIRRVYGDNGGHAAWLGFPLSDAWYYPDSTIQAFEGGYIVYYYPEVEGDRDYDREPVAYSYLAGSGTLFDVHADQIWQDTGVSVQSGDLVAVVQMDGGWTYREPDIAPFDANGSPIVQFPEREGAPLPSVLIGSLIGKIGEDGSPTFLGRWGTLTAQTDGVLYLGMNDNNYTDNAGRITVQIVVEPAD